MENATSRTALKHLRQHGDIVRVENRTAGPGTPDMNGCIHGHEFWIENKWLHHLPRHGGLVLVPKFRPEQRIWLRRRAAAGGKVYVLLGVQRPFGEFFLFNGDLAARELGTMWGVSQLIPSALVYAQRHFPTEEILYALAA